MHAAQETIITDSSAFMASAHCEYAVVVNAIHSLKLVFCSAQYRQQPTAELTRADLERHENVATAHVNKLYPKLINTLSRVLRDPVKRNKYIGTIENLGANLVCNKSNPEVVILIVASCKIYL